MNPAGAGMDTAPSGIHPAANGIHAGGNGIDTDAPGMNPEAAISDTIGAGIHTISSGIAVPRLKSGTFCKKTTLGADSEAASGLSGWRAHRPEHRRLHGRGGPAVPVRGDRNPPARDRRDLSPPRHPRLAHCGWRLRPRVRSLARRR